MDRVYEELDEVRAEMQKVKEECRTKTELSESLQEVHNELQGKYQESRMIIEKQIQELHTRSMEISDAKQLSEDLKSSLDKKELFLKQLNSVNQKLRVDYGDKIEKLEGENKELALALDEAAARNQDLEGKVSARNEEIEGLKVHLMIEKKNSLDAVERKHASKELKCREDIIVGLEEEIRNSRNQLKWKSEQFEHLEEAHLRVQIQFESCKEEWETEKSVLLEKICSLQTDLESRIRISEDLQSQLRICNQALAYEENKRTVLEVEVSEYRSRLNEICCDYEEAKSKIEILSLNREEQIADLRYSLRANETVNKEMGYKITYLEQENQDLRASLKEFQEAQIKCTGTSPSIKNLQNKLRNLEQLHEKCSMNLKEKEDKWTSKIEKLTGAMNALASELSSRNKQIQELQGDLEGCRCLLDTQNEEIEVKNIAVHSLHAELKQKSTAIALLMERDASMDVWRHKEACIDKEIQLHEKISKCKTPLKEHLKIANPPRGETGVTFGERNSESTTKIGGANQTEFRVNLEAVIFAQSEAKSVFEQEKGNLLRIMEEKEQNIDALLGHIRSLEQYLEKTVIHFAQKQIEIDVLGETLEKNEKLKKLEIEEKDKIIARLETDVEYCHQQMKLREESFFHLKQEAEKLKVLLEENNLESKRLKNQFGIERKHLEDQIKEVESQKGGLLEDIMKLSSDREDFLVQSEAICSQIGKFSSQDNELIEILAKLQQNLDNENRLANNSSANCVLHEPNSIVLNQHLSMSGKEFREGVDLRSPLNEVNH